MVARIGTFARPRRWPMVVLGLIVLLALVLFVLSRFYIDLLWFREVDLSAVYWAELRTKVLLGLVFGLVFFGLLYLNLVIVRSIVPETRVLTPDQEIVERFRQTVDPYLRWLLPIGAAVLALFVGIGAAGKWQTFLLWRGSSGVTFGTPEPLFGRDPAFYVFSMPWLRFVQGWLFSSLVGVTFITGLGHYLWGGIRPQARSWEDKVTAPVRAHLSVLLALIMLAKAWGYYLGRFDLLTSTRGAVQGASFTDVKAQLPALTFLWVVALICAVLFLINIRVRLWSLPRDRGGPAGAGLRPAGRRLSRVRAAVPREAAGAAARGALHRGQHRGDAIRVRTGLAVGPGTGREYARHLRGGRGEPRDGGQRSIVAPVGAAAELPGPPADQAVLRLQGRRRGSIHDRRRATGADGGRARGGAERDPRGESHVAEHPPRLHARLRCRSDPGQQRHDRGGSRFHPAGHPARRRAAPRAAPRVLRGGHRRPVRGGEHGNARAGLRRCARSAALCRERRYRDGRISCSGRCSHCARATSTC